jgi:hypothetical protein
MISVLKRSRDKDTDRQREDNMKTQEEGDNLQFKERGLKNTNPANN